MLSLFIPWKLRMLHMQKISTTFVIAYSLHIALHCIIEIEYKLCVAGWCRQPMLGRESFTGYECRCAAHIVSATPWPACHWSDQPHSCGEVEPTARPRLLCWLCPTQLVPQVLHGHWLWGLWFLWWLRRVWWLWWLWRLWRLWRMWWLWWLKYWEYRVLSV